MKQSVIPAYTYGLRVRFGQRRSRTELQRVML
jgi:hypothetical protein